MGLGPLLAKKPLVTPIPPSWTRGAGWVLGGSGTYPPRLVTEAQAECCRIGLEGEAPGKGSQLRFQGLPG